MFINFIIDGEFKPTDEEIFENMACNEFDEVRKISCDNLETLAAEAGVFPSKGRARKNGFCGPIPHGISFLGTKKKRFWVWNPNPPDNKPTISKSFDHTDRWLSQRIAKDGDD